MTRLLEIAQRTFSILEHTPVSVFGFNFNYQRLTRSLDVGMVLARAFTAPLELKYPDTKGAQVVVHRSQPGRSIQMTVSPVTGEPRGVGVYHNFHYTIAEVGRFDLGAKLREHYQPDCNEALQETESIVSRIDRSAEG
jgi:hypothetical protein